jgi:Arc/MetJ-type ribon-helix-helix transcriptional regulator
VNVALPPDLEDYVKSLIGSGSYAGSAQVIEEALRQHQVNRLGYEVVMTAELERLLDEGMEDPDEAKTTEELRQRR